MPETCSACGSSVQPASNYCFHCGKSLEVNDSSPHDEQDIPEEHRSWRQGVWKPGPPEESGSEPLGKSGSWREWYRWRKTSLGNLFRERTLWTRPWRGEDWSALAATVRPLTWRDWTVLVAGVAVVLSMVAAITYEEPSPSLSCRSNVEQEMMSLIKIGLFDPEAIEKVDGPRYASTLFAKAENEYRVVFKYRYPNRSGGMDDFVARGIVTYVSGEICDFQLTGIGE